MEIRRINGDGWWWLDARLWVAIFAALIIRVVGAGEHSVWFDEAAVLLATRASWWELAVTTLTVNMKLPVFHSLLKLTQLAWLPPWMLPAAFGALTVMPVFGLARRLYDNNVAWSAAWLFAFSSFNVFYSQQAVEYSMLAFLGAWSVWAFERTLRKPLPAMAWTAYTGVTVFFLLTHLYAAMLWTAFGLIRFHRFGGRKFGQWLRWEIVPVLTILLHLWILMSVWRGGEFRTTNLTPLHLANLFRHLVMSFPHPSHLKEWPVFAVPVGAAMLLSAAAMVAALRSRKAALEASVGGIAPVHFLLTCIAMPALLNYIASLVLGTYNPRYVVYVGPIFAILLAVGLRRLEGSRRVWATSAMIVLSAAGCMVFLEHPYYRWPQYREATEEWLDAGSGRPCVHLHPNSFFPAKYYGIEGRQFLLKSGSIPANYAVDLLKRGEQLNGFRAVRDEFIWVMLETEYRPWEPMDTPEHKLDVYIPEGYRILRRTDFRGISLLLITRLKE